MSRAMFYEAIAVTLIMAVLVMEFERRDGWSYLMDFVRGYKMFLAAFGG